MEKLIEKLEQAEVGSRELDREICLLLVPDEAQLNGGWSYWPSPERMVDSVYPRSVTTSLDAALALAERLGLQAGDILHEAWRAMAKKHALHMRFYTGKNYASEAALCACAALLRAQSEAR